MATQLSPQTLASYLAPATAEDLGNRGNKVDRCCICFNHLASSNTTTTTAATSNSNSTTTATASDSNNTTTTITEGEPECFPANKLSCGHIFGRECILRHLSMGSFRCPLCRQVVLAFEEPEPNCEELWLPSLDSVVPAASLVPEPISASIADLPEEMQLEILLLGQYRVILDTDEDMCEDDVSVDDLPDEGN